MFDDPLTKGYEHCGHQLRDRILALIPANPAILDMSNCWDLFDVPEFRCSDLGPTMAQATWALRATQQEYRNKVAATP